MNKSPLRKIDLESHGWWQGKREMDSLQSATNMKKTLQKYKVVLGQLETMQTFELMPPVF